MRVILLNDGGYNELSHITFPVEVVGEYASPFEDLVDVTADEIIRIGAYGWELDYGDLAFIVHLECEVLPE